MKTKLTYLFSILYLMGCAADGQIPGDPIDPDELRVESFLACQKTQNIVLPAYAGGIGSTPRPVTFRFDYTELSNGITLINCSVQTPLLLQSGSRVVTDESADELCLAGLDINGGTGNGGHFEFQLQPNNTATAAFVPISNPASPFVVALNPGDCGH